MAFLASGDARLITGINLPVDAGLRASNGQPRRQAYFSVASSFLAISS